MCLTELAKKIDISCVQAFHTRDEIDSMVEAAIRYHFAAAFTLPAFSSYIAKKLAEYIFKITRAQIIANNDMEFSKNQTDNYINSIKKISTGIPIQYITNNQEFMNLNFYDFS